MPTSPLGGILGPSRDAHAFRVRYAVFLTGLMQFGYTRRYFTSEDRWLKTHVSEQGNSCGASGTRS